MRSIPLPRPRALAPLALALALALSGCVAPSATQLDREAASSATVVASATPLWNDPQNTPHPAFGWPTLVNPAEGADVPAWWAPIPAAKLPDPITGIEHLVQTPNVTKGGGIALFGSLAVVPGYGDPSHVVDISDPAAPKILGSFEPGSSAHRGAAIVAFPDGRLVTAISTGFGFETWDITDPTNPEMLASVEAPRGGHKIGIVPGTPILYNANSNGGESFTAFRPAQGEGATEIYDLTDPAKPVLLQEFANGFGCHHIYFWNAADKARATCAGIEFAQIWDTTDPRAPEVIVSVPIPLGHPEAPSLSPVPFTPWAHFAILNDDGTVLVVGDELGGGGVPPGCTAPRAPTGALWFYDVSDETNPQVLGWFSPGHHLEPDNAMASCTAHHGRLVPTPDGRDLLAMSFYGAGVVLVDFTQPRAAMMVDQFKDHSDTWETWYYNGYLFTGDLLRGMDVLKLT